MTSKLIKKVLECAMIGTLLIGNGKEAYAPIANTGYTIDVHRQFLWDRAVKEQNADKLRKPYFKLKPSHCSKYARLSAKKLFNKEYNEGHAWDLKYKNSVVDGFYDFNKETDVENAIMDGRLKQGMLITAKWPVKDIKKYWTYKNKKGFDMAGNPIDATHVIVYDGIGKITDKEILAFPEPIFIHQFGSKIERKTQKQLWEDYKLEFIKVINDKELPKNTATTFPEKYF